MKRVILSALIIPCIFLSFAAQAQDGSRLREWIEKRKEASHTTRSEEDKNLQGRPFSLYVPKTLPSSGQRSMVVALHGGTGWSTQFQKQIGMDSVANKYNFIVLYLNGTQAAERMREKRSAWNAGSCCGLPASKNIDDVSYVIKATQQIAREYGVDPQKIYIMGHSNGAMMSARVMCEENLFHSAVLISGALNTHATSCPAAKGKNISAIHGDKDSNYPIQGGVGSISIVETDYVSQQESADVFNKSGANYTVMIVKNAEHKPESIDTALVEQTGQSLPQTIVRFFGLTQ